MVNPSLLEADSSSMMDVEPEMFNAADDALALLEGQEPASEKTDTDFFNSFDDDFDDEDVA